MPLKFWKNPTHYVHLKFQNVNLYTKHCVILFSRETCLTPLIQVSSLFWWQETLCSQQTKQDVAELMSLGDTSCNTTILIL